MIGGFASLPQLISRHLKRESAFLKGLGGDAFFLSDEAQQDVFSTDEPAIGKPRLFLGKDENSPTSVGKPFKHIPRLQAVW
jgi:hypothetical protein